MIMLHANISYPDYTHPYFSDARSLKKSEMLKNYRNWSRLFPENQAIKYWATEGKEGALPENLSKGHLNTGFFTFRNSWEKECLQMVVKAGPPAFWHNQPDNGTFEIWYNGKVLFQDSGAYVYGGGEEIMQWRNWFRRTASHNTLTFADRDIQTMDSKTLLWQPEGDVQILVTENPSYTYMTHRRSVFFVDGKYFVISTVSSIMSPDTGKRLRTRDVMINTLDVKRANGQSWLQALNMAFMPCYAKLEGKTYDFPEVQWYRDGVGYVLKNSLIANYENGYFGPKDLASRGVAVNALWKMDGKSKAAAGSSFADVPAGSKYFDAVCWAEENGIAGGYTDSFFGVEDTLTREQMAALLWRYAKYQGYDVSVGENTNILSYDDAFEISEYAIPAMQWACGSGLLIGEKTANGGMVLNPQNKTTRAQLSMMLMRFDTWMKQAKIVPNPNLLQVQPFCRHSFSKQSLPVFITKVADSIENKS
jgi:hypothetical protein